MEQPKPMHLLGVNGIAGVENGNLIQSLLDSPQVTMRQLAKLLGHLTSTIQAVFPGPLHFRHLQNEKNRALVHSQTYDSSTPLPPQAKEELVWWRDNLGAWNGKSLVSGFPDLVIETDASQQGWGRFAAECPQGVSGLKGKLFCT